jgi:hypothetical protein
MSTKVEIVSLAIGLLGHAPVITLDEGDSDSLTTAAEQAFNFLLGASLAKSNWRFATRISQLTNLVETPVTHWNSVWQLPAGYLKHIKLWPTPRYDYEIYEDRKIYAMWGTGEEIFMEHIFQPDVSRLPAWFVEYFIYEIATFLSLSNAKKTEFFSVLKAEKTQALAVAMGIDAQNRPNQSQVDIPMLNISRDVRGY